MKNTFYQQILDALDSDLDDQLFEHCVANLLESDFPGISPISGGSDSGMDGGVFDGEGTPFPLVTTIGADCTGNLRRNLLKYIEDGGERRKAVFATSQKLTPLRRKNLRKVAKEVGFDLVQEFEQTAIADRLYRSPNWCKELLGLIGKPEALTIVPSGARRLLGENIFGQDSIVEALKNSASDKVLVGPPGSGKTFLLYHLARQNLGLFVESNDMADVANGIREHQPQLLFVDDAINRRDLVTSLKRIRRELDADYKIVSCGWTSHQDLLIDDLDLQPVDALLIQRLSRDEIVEVIGDTGIRYPVGLVNEIVRQADGLPGLAVTICAAALHGDIEAVSSADSLTKFLVNRLSKEVDDRSRQVLAVIGLTGNYGASLTQVSKALGISSVEIQRIATGLALGGVLHEVDETKLIVRPVRLRGALIRDVFFAGPLSLDVEPVLADLDEGTVANELIHAKHLGGKVPDTLIRQELSKRRTSYYNNGDDPVASYAYLGPEEAVAVLEELGDDISKYYEPLLQHAPQESIKRMLKAAIGDDRALHSHPDHPLRKLQDWIKDSKPGSAEAIEKRVILLDTAIRWLEDRGDSKVFATAIEAAFSPACEWLENKPGSGMSVTIYRSCLPKDQIPELINHWSKVLQTLGQQESIEWGPFFSLLHVWVYPQILQAKIDESTYQTIRAHAARIIKGLAVLSKSSPGIQQKLRAYSEKADADIEFACDEHFDILFPDDDHLYDRKKRRSCFRQAEELANEYKSYRPMKLAELLKRFEHERTQAQITLNQCFLAFCESLAVGVDDPLKYINTLMAQNVTAETLWPFVARLLAEKPDGYESAIKDLLNNDEFKIATTISVLQNGANDELVDLALENTPISWRAIETSVLRGEIKNEIIARLLRNDDPVLAAAVAWALWHRDPAKSVPDDLIADWKQAVVNSYACDRTPHNLDDLFDAYPELAFQWVLKFANDTEKGRKFSSSNRAGELCKKLTKEQKLLLIDEMTAARLK